MRDEDQIFNLATDVANCVPVRTQGKMSVRSSILRIVVLAVKAYRKDPSIMDRLEAMAKYSS